MNNDLFIDLIQAVRTAVLTQLGLIESVNIPIVLLFAKCIQLALFLFTEYVRCNKVRTVVHNKASKQSTEQAARERDRDRYEHKDYSVCEPHALESRATVKGVYKPITKRTECNSEASCLNIFARDPSGYEQIRQNQNILRQGFQVNVELNPERKAPSL